MEIILNTGFKITNAGLAAASSATPTGPYINIAQFKVGSGVNYAPTGNETGLQGTTLYTGVPTSFSIVDTDTIECLLIMDQTVGPFNFGEIGIYLSTGQLFALSVFTTLQEKLNLVGNQAGTRWIIRARLRLAQLPAVCTVTIINSMQLLELPSWPALSAPVNMINPANAAIIHEENMSGDSLLVIRDNDYEWSVLGYNEVLQETTTTSGVTFTPTSVTSPGIANLGLELPQTNSRYLIKFPNGLIRKIVSQPNATTLVWTPATIPGTGAYSILEDCCGSGLIRFADTFEYNQQVANFNPYWSTPSEGTTLAIAKGLNQTAIPTIANHPSLANWATFINAVKAACKIHNVPFSDIVATNFSYPSSGNPTWGLATIMQQWNTLVSKIGLIEANKTIADPLYQDLSTSTATDSSRVTEWPSTISHAVTYDFTDSNDFFGSVNGGFSLKLAGNVVSGTSNLWTDLNALMISIGSITIERNRTYCSTNFIPQTNLGFYTVPSGPALFQINHRVFQLTYAPTIDRSVSVSIFLEVFNTLQIKVTMTIGATGYGAYYSSSTGNFISRMRMTKPSSAVLTTPVLAFPTETLVNSLT